MSYSTSGLVEVVLNNDSATTNPTVSSDSTQGYSVQSRWTNVSTDAEFVCVDASAGAAAWLSTTETGTVTNYGVGEWRFDTDVTDTDPGAGDWKLNNADETLATFLYIDDLTISGRDASNIIQVLGNGNYLVIQRTEDSSEALSFQVTGAPTDGTGYWKIPISHDSSDTGGWTGGSAKKYSFLLVGGGGGGAGDVTSDGTTAQDAVLITERADHVNIPAAGFGELWVRNDAVQTFIFTDDAGTDFVLPRVSAGITADGILTAGPGTDGVYTPESSLRYTSGRLRISSATSVIEIGDRAAAPTNVANTGSIWVRDDAPTTPMFTDSTGGDHRLNIPVPTVLATNELIGIDQTEIVIGGGYIDGSTGGTFSWEALAEQIDGGGGVLLLTSEIRLYDMGPDGTPAAGTLRSSLEFPTDDALDRVTLTLTASGSPGTDTDTIFNTARMYEVRAYLDSTGGNVDSLRILSVKFVES